MRLSKDWTQAEMGHFLGVSKEMVNKMEAGTYKISKRTALSLARLQAVKVEQASTFAGGEKNDGIPFFDVDFAAGSVDLDNDQTTVPLYYMDIPDFRGCIAFRAYSDSMEDLIKSGSILFAKRIEAWQHHIEFGQVYAITMNDGRRYLKYIKRAKTDSRFLLRSRNKHYDDFEIERTDVAVVFLIEGWLNRQT